jgi:hypothetical protein
MQRLLFALLLVGLMLPAPAAQSQVPAPAALAIWHTAVEGVVTAATTGAPVPGAKVSLPALGLFGTTDAAGAFAWQAVPLPAPVVTVTLAISAAGFGVWSIHDVRLFADDTLLLSPQLGLQPITITVPAARSTAEDWVTLAGDAGLDESFSLHNVQLPATIRVRVTGYPHCDTSRPYTVQVIDFREYVKHVLPSEWIASWQRESLRSGAMAVKMYAWYWIARGGKWNNADVYDSTCDQVYNPAVAYASTNAAVDHTWNWRLTRAGQIFQTSYRAHYHQCLGAGLAGRCLGQWDSKAMADGGSLWPAILAHFYWDTELATIGPPIENFALRFYGNQLGSVDQLRLRVDDPATTAPGPPVDVGATDFTIEWWMQAGAPSSGDAVACGAGSGWLDGVGLLDRDRVGQDRKYGVSLARGALVFGVAGDGTGAYTLCGSRLVTDGAWHHVAVARRRGDGYLWLWVDGELDASGPGPAGDISYPDAGVPADLCGRSGRESCAGSDPFLIIGAGKRPGGQPRPSYAGSLDEVRFSTALRYQSTFRPAARFSSDAHTAAYFNFDDAGWTGPCSSAVTDGAQALGGPSSAQCLYGGSPRGPAWVASTLAVPLEPWIYLPILVR